MDIGVKTTSYQTENRDWLSSNFGCDEPRTITFDVAKLTQGSHYPNGFVPSGMVVGKVTATGLYGPYDNAANDGREVAVGITFDSVEIKTGTTKVGLAMLEMGLIVEARMPFGAGTGQVNAVGKIDSAGKTDLAGWFKFL